MEFEDDPAKAARNLKKTEEMRAEYRREDLGKGVRGKHYAEFKKGSNLVLLTPELEQLSGLARGAKAVGYRDRKDRS